MSLTQRIVLWIGLALFVLFGAFHVPYYSPKAEGYYRDGYGVAFSLPMLKGPVDISGWVIQQLLIVITFGGVALLLHRRH